LPCKNAVKFVFLGIIKTKMKNKYVFLICFDIDTKQLRPSRFSVYNKDIQGQTRFETFQQCQEAIENLKQTK